VRSLHDFISSHLAALRHMDMTQDQATCKLEKSQAVAGENCPADIPESDWHGMQQMAILSLKLLVRVELSQY
jgi:uncharacterized ParB-like nuclease family protein